MARRKKSYLKSSNSRMGGKLAGLSMGEKDKFLFGKPSHDVIGDKQAIRRLIGKW